NREAFLNLLHSIFVEWKLEAVYSVVRFVIWVASNDDDDDDDDEKRKSSEFRKLTFRKSSSYMRNFSIKCGEFVLANEESGVVFDVWSAVRCAPLLLPQAAL
ncbi:hypothetical protein U1Q18_045287, partial [Sarracenia purpurea var. burkii]